MTNKKHTITLNPADFLKWDPSEKRVDLIELDFNKSSEKSVFWDPTDYEEKIF